MRGALQIVVSADGGVLDPGHAALVRCWRQVVGGFAQVDHRVAVVLGTLCVSFVFIENC